MAEALAPQSVGLGLAWTLELSYYLSHDLHSKMDPTCHWGGGLLILKLFSFSWFANCNRRLILSCLSFLGSTVSSHLLFRGVVSRAILTAPLPQETFVMPSRAFLKLSHPFWTRMFSRMKGECTDTRSPSTYLLDTRRSVCDSKSTVKGKREREIALNVGDRVNASQDLALCLMV